jgi:hypothetical protein
LASGHQVNYIFARGGTVIRGPIVPILRSIEENTGCQSAQNPIIGLLLGAVHYKKLVSQPRAEAPFTRDIGTALTLRVFRRQNLFYQQELIIQKRFDMQRLLAA